MTKKQFLKWVDKIPKDATLDDIGFIGLPFATEEEKEQIKKEGDALMKDAIRRYKESNKDALNVETNVK
ncbi:MAG: hypothetical protein J7578_23280 [Chitinophagaceae bacterium]|nr:hypothetical protein [Chitinophagaceae bacterium]